MDSPSLIFPLFFQAVIDAGVCRRLVELLTHQQPNVISSALRAVGNIVTGDDVQTQVILNCQALPCLHHLLGSSKESVRKEACWTISNITAGNRQQIQVIFLLLPLLSLPLFLFIHFLLFLLQVYFLFLLFVLCFSCVLPLFL